MTYTYAATTHCNLHWLSLYPTNQAFTNVSTLCNVIALCGGVIVYNVVVYIHT